MSEKITGPSPPFFELPGRFAGVRVVGDVHGDAGAFSAAIAGAREQNLFVIQIGDLVDRGADSPACLRLAFDLLAAGDGLFILGNHEEKLRRALAPQNNVELGDDLARTLAAIAAAPQAQLFREEVLAALDAAPLWLRLGRHFIVHGGFDPAMLDYAGPQAMPSRRFAKEVANRALRGEPQRQLKGQPAPLDAEGYPIRLYNWVDQVPDGLTVIIGHDSFSTTEIVERRGALGGRVLFCDTGCGKGGKLSWIDVPRREL